MQKGIILIFSIFLIALAGGNNIHDRLYIRQNFTDLILKENEIIRYPLNRYFGGSINQYSLALQLKNGTYVKDWDVDMESIVSLNQPYESMVFKEDKKRRNIQPIDNLQTLIYIRDPISSEQIMMLFIDEFYVLTIIDFSDYQLEEYRIVKEYDLLFVFNDYIRSSQNTSDV